MRKRPVKLMLAPALGALALLFASQAAMADSRDLDRQQIMALMAELDETWNRHDMRAHAALFHEDGIWIAWTGEVLSGREAYETTLTRLHQTVFRTSVHDGRVEELKFIGPDAAVVRGYGTAIGNEPTPEVMERYRILVVLTRRDGAWKMSWGQKTRFKEGTPGPDPQ